MKTNFFFGILVLLLIFGFSLWAVAQEIAQEPETPAENKEETKPNWQCEFGWSPPSFNCYPREPEDTTPEQDDEITKQQAALVQSIQEKEKEVKAKELALKKKQSDLRSLEQRIERKLDEMKAIQMEIEKSRKEKSEEEAKDLDLLVKIYEGMDPESAATIINTMDKQTAANLILRMNPRKSSGILQAIQPKVAQEISEIIAHIKANREAAQNL